MEPWNLPEVWQSVATELRRYRREGLGALLTEDTVRFAAARALVAAGADPTGMRAEWPHPSIKGARIDLVGGGSPPSVLIEFKYPREPNEKNAAWTMALGEVLKDLYRLAVAPIDARRIFVYVETMRLREYMRSSAARYGLELDRDEIALRPEDASRLPDTASRTIGAELAAHHVTAQRTVLAAIDADLRMSVYAVDPLGTEAQGPAAIAASADRPSVLPQMAPPHVAPPAPIERSGARDGARREILEAVTRVLTRSHGDTFTPAQVVTEMKRHGTGYAESTIRTMITSHMCANAPDHAAVTFDDFERLGPGVYRVLPPSHANRSEPCPVR